MNWCLNQGNNNKKFEGFRIQRKLRPLKFGLTPGLVWYLAIFWVLRLIPFLNIGSKLALRETEGTWNAIANSMLSGPGSPWFDVALDCAIGIEHSAELDIANISLSQGILRSLNFPVISDVDLNKFLLPAVPGSGVSSAWG